ncbi:pyridoxal phosphate-dependent aminotransferase [Sphingopyxis sp. JAI128]|uniref:pyridoxal phosphate-dependent aminotransferase n=1 Tax=Sphingopyxis sp. JAI128 TaxID=2723066 RepID=UPI0016132D4D|nr:pyridoxal phosphate-dependent aminotransferase [Sphingopyxis sp. JAI128]MBB6426933.1 aspartate/methionine/tyrosine aminotransferase [Sphingopyxis sp. JAI128]
MNMSSSGPTKRGIIALLECSGPHPLAGSTAPPLDVSAMLSSVGPSYLPYGHPGGSDKLKEAIASVCGVPAEDIIVVPGATAGLALAASCALAAGGEALLVTPGYPPARDYLRTLRATVYKERTTFDRAYRLDIDRMGRRLSAATRLVCLATPGNPGGQIVPCDDIRRLADMVKVRAPQAILVVDETFREAGFGGKPAPSAAGLGAQVVTIGSLSKAYGVPGLRMGWIAVSDPLLRQSLIEAAANLFHSCPVLEEGVATAVLSQHESILAEQGAMLLERLVITLRWLERHASALEWTSPDAGAIIALRHLGAGAVRDFPRCLAGHGVALAPATLLGDHDDIYRLGFGLRSTQELHKALDALGAALRQAAPTMAVAAEPSRLGELVQKLVSGTLPKDDWTHDAHLGACLWLLRHRTAEQVSREMPGIIRRYNEAVGTPNSDQSGYHATITEFYVRALGDFLVANDRGQPVDELFGLLQSSPLAARDYPLRSYSRERLFSVAARRCFVSPDRCGRDPDPERLPGMSGASA